MDIEIYLFVAILGAAVGSFCNVCIFRIPTQKDVIFGRSKCMHCDKVLKYWELIPVLSWYLQKGKCSKCNKPISIQYPLIEIINSILWLIVFIYFGVCMDFVLGAFLVSSLLVISVIDAKTRLIPPQITIFIGILGIIRTIINYQTYQEHLIGFVSIAGVLLVLFIISKGTAIGGGDIKLMAGAGLYLGWKLTLLSFMLASFFGSGVHIVKMKVFNFGNELALGPYLAVGIVISLIWGNALISNYLSYLAI